MYSELACGRVSKLLLEVAIDLRLNLIVKNFNFLIVDLFYLDDSEVKSSPSFYLETVCLIGFPKLSYRSVIYFSASLHDMIYFCLT